MTIAQIMAIVSLLMAFGVDRPTINTVENILIASTQTHVIIQEMPKQEVPKNPDYEPSYFYITPSAAIDEALEHDRWLWRTRLLDKKLSPLELKGMKLG